MLKLTKRTEYGLIALVHLAENPGRVVSAREIGEQYPVPRRLLAEVLKDLQHAHLIDSQRGAHGGYSLAFEPKDISIGKVVQALEGAPALTECQSAPIENECEVKGKCPIRNPLERIRSGIWSLMENTTLSSLLEPSQFVAAPSGTTPPTNGAE
ncbi:MAG: Rrf2 family transcriptional regulator [bacterium]|nr:Rrf2 family transcriptional regulator [bacterium]